MWCVTSLNLCFEMVGINNNETHIHTLLNKLSAIFTFFFHHQLSLPKLRDGRKSCVTFSVHAATWLTTKQHHKGVEKSVTPSTFLSLRLHLSLLDLWLDPSVSSVSWSLPVSLCLVWGQRHTNQHREGGRLEPRGWVTYVTCCLQHRLQPRHNCGSSQNRASSDVFEAWEVRLGNSVVFSLKRL